MDWQGVLGAREGDLQSALTEGNSPMQGDAFWDGFEWKKEHCGRSSLYLHLCECKDTHTHTHSFLPRYLCSQCHEDTDSSRVSHRQKHEQEHHTGSNASIVRYSWLLRQSDQRIILVIVCWFQTKCVSLCLHLWKAKKSLQCTVKTILYITFLRKV